mgnify:CR=1 FL=1
MKITLDIPDKYIREGIGDALDYSIYCDFGKDEIQASGIPSRTAMIEEIFSDSAFIAKFVKLLQKYAAEDMRDSIYFTTESMKIPAIERYRRRVQLVRHMFESVDGLRKLSKRITRQKAVG